MIENDLGGVERLTISYSDRFIRPKLSSLFALDQRLAVLIRNSKEPLLSQLKLAWWRDVLSKPVSDRPIGEPLIEALNGPWRGSEGKLQMLIDAWEGLLLKNGSPRSIAQNFIDVRINVFADCFGNQEGAQIAFRRWSCADAAYHTKDQDERKIFLELGSDFASGARSPGTSLRGLCILNVLSSRALNKGGGPLLDDTLSVLVALRVGIFGF